MAKVIPHYGHFADKRYHVESKVFRCDKWGLVSKYNDETEAILEALAGEERGIIEFWRVVDTQPEEETVAEQRTEGHKPRSEGRFRRWLRTGRFSARVGVPEEGTEAS